MGTEGEKGNETGMQGGRNAPRERTREKDDQTLLDEEGEAAEDYERKESTYSREPEEPEDDENDADGVKG